MNETYLLFLIEIILLIISIFWLLIWIYNYILFNYKIKKFEKNIDNKLEIIDNIQLEIMNLKENNNWKKIEEYIDENWEKQILIPFDKYLKKK